MIECFKKNFSGPIKKEEICSKGDMEFFVEIKNRILGRCWEDVKITDWASIADVSVIYLSLPRHVFIYYLPSILLGGLADVNYLDWALRSLLPSRLNGVRYGGAIPGKDWYDYIAAFSHGQKGCIKKYINCVENIYLDDFSFGNFIEGAVLLWNDA